ncbi:MAG: tetratricopeptide repeat protein [Chloroflexi bacterium]|nr:tetratricopeptide repeat protein [Chloroflexota bacterium]
MLLTQRILLVVVILLAGLLPASPIDPIPVRDVGPSSQSGEPSRAVPDAVVDRPEAEELDLRLDEEARGILPAIRDQNSGRVEAAEDLTYVGAALLYAGEVSSAHEQFEKAVAANPDYPESFVYLGYTSWLRGNYSDADYLLRRYVQLRPDAPLGHYFLGMLRRSQNSLPEAVSEFETVLVADPQSAPARIELARTLTLKRDYGRAAGMLDLAVEIDPDNVAYLLYVATFYLDHAIRLDRALPLARKAAELAPGDAGAMDVLGWALWANGQSYEARHTLERALAARPDLAGAHYHLAVIYEKEGDAPAAAAELRRVLELEPDGDYAARARFGLNSLGSR